MYKYNACIICIHIMKTIILRKRYIVLAVCLILCLSIFLALPTIATSVPKTSLCIVIDAGHGGIDGGSVGKNTGKDENFLNLEYAKTLKEIFENYNIKVVMTRSDLNGLYDIASPNKKKSDMAKRKEIILNSKANMVISIHMNSFPLKSSKGAQVFYKDGDISSQTFARSIQEIFVKTLPSARKNASIGDYFILNCSNIPSVIVECGFLSNPEEEELLVSEEYKQTVCTSIFLGTLNFLAK